MLDRDNVQVKVLGCLESACGLDRGEINVDSSLIDDLGLESIDLVDLVYELERAFDLTINVGELERMARKEVSGAFEVAGRLTEAGKEALRQLAPEIPQSKVVAGMPVYNLPRLYTVGALCAVIQRKLELSS